MCKNCTIDGQISLFDFFTYGQEAEAPILLFPNQKIYRVNRGDVILYTVLLETWSYGNDRAYRLLSNDGSYYVAYNSELGRNFFTIRDQAEYVAHDYILCHDVVLAESMKAVDTVAYSYIRESDNRRMVSFYSVLENGYVYMKEFMTYSHLVNSRKAINRFLKQSEIVISEKISYTPVFKNMYRCCENDTWIYAEAEYGGCK